ncbi:MAG: hypothetical protein ACM33B_15455 [Pseudomonadota bacterium]
MGGRPKRSRLLPVAGVAAVASLALAAPSSARREAAGPTAATAGARAVAALRSAAARRATSVRVARPAGVRTGDVLVAAVAVRASRGVAIHPPEGWRLVRRDGGRALSQALYVHVARRGEPGRYAWRWRGHRSAVAAILVYRGVDGARPVGGHAGAAGGSARLRATTSVATQAPVVVSFAAGSGVRTLRVPAGLIVRSRVAVGSGRARLVLAGGDAAGASVGPLGATGGGATVRQVLALRAAAATRGAAGTGRGKADKGPGRQQAPTSVAPPTITGEAAEGQTLRATPGTWQSSTTVSYAFQWRRCDAAGASCTDVAGAQSDTLQLPSALVGATVRVAVRATNAAGSTTAVSAPSAVVAPPAVPVPSSLSTGQRWFSDASPLNTPIPTGAEADPASRAMVAGMEYAVAQNGFSISVKRWSVPVYYADRTTPRQTVALDAPWTIPAHSLVDVPFPADARPDPAGDQHMAVIDRDTGCYYEYYKLFQRTDGAWQARWANRGALGSTGVYPSAFSTRASGFVNFAGLIRPEELQRGSIDHALVFGHPFTKSGGPVLPATDSDGRPESESGAAVGLTRPADALPIPEGARVQLDPTLNLDTLGLSPWQKVIARALQRYGMYLADTAGTTSLTAVNPQSFSSNPYLPFWGDATYAYLPPALLPHMRVLKLGTQFSPNRVLLDSPCGVMR